MIAPQKLDGNANRNTGTLIAQTRARSAVASTPLSHPQPARSIEDAAGARTILPQLADQLR